MHDAGSKADVSPARRSRAAVTRENSAALRGAVVRCIAEAGWESLSVRKVSAAAGLSYGAIYTRVERLEDLVAETWSEVLWPILRDCLDVIIESVLVAADEDRFVEELHRLCEPTEELLAAVELLQASLVDDAVGRFVRPDVEAFLLRHTDPDRAGGSVSAVVAATCCYVAVGLLLLARRSWTHGTNLDPELRRYHQALLSPTEAVPAPIDMLAEYLYVYGFDTEDDRLERVLMATAISVGEVGYHATTIARICRTAGVSSGFVMGRFPSKIALFRRVTEEMWGRGLSRISAFIAEAAAEIGPGMAEALAWREMQNPAIVKVSILSIETARLAAFEPTVAELIEAPERDLLANLPEGVPQAFIHSEYAMGNGMIALACFRPALCELPFSCVTETLVATAPH